MFSEHLDGCQQALDFFYHTQLGFKELLVKEKAFSDETLCSKLQTPGSLNSKLMDAKTTHNIYDENGKIAGLGTFDKDDMESEGQRK